MKRKIEKYLSNNDKDRIRIKEDGRYDFKGDLEGVLTAVREGPIDGGATASKKLNCNDDSLRNANKRPHLEDGGDGVGGAHTPGRKITKFAESMFSNNRSAYTNSSASRNLFVEASSSKLEDSDCDSGSDDMVANNIFISPPPSCKKRNPDFTKADSNQKRNLRSTFTTGRASIMETPMDSKHPPAGSPVFGSMKTPDVMNLDLRGYTPLSNNGKHQEEGNNTNFAEILDSGLFSPGWPLLGRDFVAEANPNNVSILSTSFSSSFAEGIRTPHARDHPRMCIANVRFGDDVPMDAMDRMQREVAISPISNMKEMMEEKKGKRQLLFGKKLDSDRKSNSRLPCVTPSISVKSSTTIVTHPLTICSSVNSDRTTPSLEELSKIRPIRINSSIKVISKSEQNMNDVIDEHTFTSSSLESSFIEPKYITQDTPLCRDDRSRSSPPVGSILQSSRKLNAGTPAEKFWSSVGGLENFTPFKVNGDEGEGAANGLLSTSNSEYEPIFV
jgi:hypothetical protein